MYCYAVGWFLLTETLLMRDAYFIKEYWYFIWRIWNNGKKNNYKKLYGLIVLSKKVILFFN